MLHFWDWAVSEAGCDGRGGGYVHGAKHWGALSVLPAAAGDGTHSDPCFAGSLGLSGDVSVGARFADGHSAIRDCAYELDWAGADHQRVWVGHAGCVHDCDSNFDVYFDAVVGLSNAAATLVGQNLGAKQPERAEISVWRTGFYNMIFLGVIGVFFLIYATPVVRLFTQDPEVVPLAASCLRILSYGNIGYAYGMVMLQAFNGAGDTVTPTVVNFFGFWLLEIPLAYFLALRVGWQAKGAYVSICVAECAIGLAGDLF